MQRKFGEVSNDYSVAFAWIPTRVKTHCDGIWHYKWIWFKTYRYHKVLYTQSNQWHTDKFVLKG